ncbi:MAG: hypothetical protein ACOCXG_01115 [Nanoarchaeota archaeon]
MKDSIGTKIIDIMKSFRVWLLLFFIVISLFAVNFSFGERGVVINGIVPGSQAEKAGISFDSKTSLKALEEVVSINGERVDSVEEFYNLVSSLEYNKSFTLTTEKESYDIFLPALGENATKSEIIGISVREEPASNIQLGIELEGGSRLILEPVDNLTDGEFELLKNTLQNRLDIFGASGTKVSKLEDGFSGDKFISVESTSSNKNEIFELIKRQGEFEAKIGNDTVFTGDNINRVLTETNLFQGCSGGNGQDYVCSYAFSVSIDEGGADAFFEKTKTLDIVNNQYLSEKVYFYLDGREITGLNIASSFKFQKVSSPQITVSGDPLPDKQNAIESAQKEMKYLQAILSTQSLPSELEVVQSYSISSSQGEKLLENAFIVGLISLLVVAGIVALRYRHIGIFIGICVALVGEVIIVLGAASFLRGMITIDLAAIGGLIAAIGSGVDDNVIITDEYFRKRNEKVSSRKKIKNAITVVLIAYSTTVVAMLPFAFSVALSLVKGFALMVVLGVTVGVFITRPAYAQILRVVLTTRKERKAEDEDED